MRVAILKEYCDPFGPWCSVRYRETTPIELLSVWPFKTSYFEMTTLLKADWYVLPVLNSESWFARATGFDAAERRRVFDKYVRGIVAPDDLPLADYDVVISLNITIVPPRDSKALFCYYLEEHADVLFCSSLRGPLAGYDLFLDHMGWSTSRLVRLPQSIFCPYARDPATMRAYFCGEKEDIVWIDARTVMRLAKSDLWNGRCDETARELADRLQVPVQYKGDLYRGFWKVDDPPRWSESVEFLRKLGRCKFYISLFASGPGQGLAEAASLGSICIGNARIPYHRMICHPFCLCRNIAEAISRVHELVGSPSLQEEVVGWQDERISKSFSDGVIGLLSSALDMKRNTRRGWERVSDRLVSMQWDVWSLGGAARYLWDRYRTAAAARLTKLLRR